ncbi:farnesyltranstransferase [Aspergillus nomiae NRRL 13137]|uniref:Farnesyltranstransferase n=1 Tax=Aspergillus nomiae NRRL (strain ATCC 15546 / NRRL 13137 / CBS 260.88 / M93) TaxID=1509407 RepID=A0A0L1ILB9_ASPN3|nr:farnesyltranstransferase [Aspergillus nomiae NRRL 13137]KNG80406.1 farnesyltranstransferase [Aspergillus nomiae NRRL 13137]
MTVTPSFQIGSPPTSPLAYAGPVAAYPRSKDQIICGPLDYLLSSGGKNIRHKLILAFNEWLQIPPNKVDIISDIVNLLHTASLLIDDIQDSSRLRRGKPVAHSIFGVAQTINSANYAYFLAQQKLSSWDSTRANDVFIEELLNLHRGQGMELHWRETLTCPTEAEYIGMVLDKTGGLFRLAVKLMQLESNQKCDCIPLMNKIGAIYQIRDDILNLKASEYTKNKGFCEDITEGKFSFPIVHSINSDPKNTQLLNILRQRSDDIALKACAVDYITSTQSFTYSYTKLNSLIVEAKSMVDELDAQMGPSTGMSAFLETLKLD